MMVNGLILLIQVGLLALLVLLAIRMITLVRSEPWQRAIKKSCPAKTQSRRITPNFPQTLPSGLLRCENR